MSRQKKIKTVHVEENPGALMTDTQTLESIETEIDKARLELENTRKQIEEQKQQLKYTPAREISEEEKRLSEKQVAMTSEKRAMQDKLEKDRLYDNIMVTGKFINRRAPGQQAKLTYCKHATDNPKWWPLEDGKVYTIPRGFADQINEHYYTPHFIQKAGEMDPNKPASAIHEVDTSNKKYAFVPVNF